MTLSKLILEMKKLGWTMGVLQFPPALHLDVTGLTTKTGVIDEFIKVRFSREIVIFFQNWSFSKNR